MKYKSGTDSSDIVLVTVFSDASYKDGDVGVGWWFKSAGLSKTGGCSARGSSNNTHAELLSILEGVKAALAAHEGQNVTLVVQNDSLGALGRILSGVERAYVAKGTSRFIPPCTASVADEKHVLAELRKLSFDKMWLKHVKGHIAKGDNRNKVNCIVDAIAKQYRKSLSEQ